jgi:serine/threonine protein kinase/tetratricopeptide (TPR) repeat protein
MINRRYEIINKIGEGRSSVFLCSDKESYNKKVALKVLTNYKDAADLASFRNEFLTLKNLEHPSIINAIEEGSVLESSYPDITFGSKFFTLEYFPGHDLLSIDNYSEKDITEIIIQISSVLFYLHQSNIIYYDLKPENILISYVNDKPYIKLIDFGLSRRVSSEKENYVFGTAEYIAPELLRKEVHNHRVDLYSFGILLYRLIYHNFPFERKSEIEIYKSHLEKEFSFPDSGYSLQIINIVKKLLSKDPKHRYSNSIEILEEIDNSQLIRESKNWSPAKLFVDRTEAYTTLKTYLSDQGSSEIFTIKGPEGSGKSFLLNKLYSEHVEGVLLSYNKAKPGLDFIKEMLLRILFNEIIFNTISNDLKSKIQELISSPADDIIEQINAVFSKISQDCNFFILFDNFNELDELAYDVIKNIIPILQVNKRKFILAEDSVLNIRSNEISELHEISLTSFTESDLTEFLEKSYFPEFPKNDLKKIILSYADLLPGNIAGFIKDILMLGILDYSIDGIKIITDESTKILLQSSHDDIYGLRISSLSVEESSAVEMISLFDISIDNSAASLLYGKSQQEWEAVISSLQQKNIIYPPHLRDTLNFTSEGMKNYVYSGLKDKKVLHYQTALKIQQNNKDFNRVELARQFELASAFKESYNVIKEELTAAEKISAYSYKKKILQRYLGLPLGNEELIEIKSDLVFVLYNLSEFVSAEKLINELLIEDLSQSKREDLLTLKGTCLIGSGNIETGKNLLNSLIIKISDNAKRLKLLAEVANAEYELNNYNEAANISAKIINDKMTDGLEKGKCYSLLGLISIFKDNNLTNALNYFESAENCYKAKDLNFKVAQMQKNIGNIYNMRGEHSRAEEYWNKCLEVTLSIGNLELEAKLLLSYGIYHFEKLNFEKALEYYSRAHSIFMSLGNSNGQGLVNYNLGEIYFLTCEYEKAIEALENSIKIFKTLRNLNEEMESLFLLGKIFYTITDLQSLNIVIRELKEGIENEKAFNKHKINYYLLNQLYSFASGSVEETITALSEIKDQYLEIDDKLNYFFTADQLINIRINLGFLNDAASDLNDKSFIDLCTQDKLLYAKRNYLFALLSSKDKIFGNQIDYLLEAFKFINESSITELSWKVLYHLADIYHKRGNYSKSEEYNSFAMSVLNYIFNNINSEKIKSFVMESRKEVYKELLEMQKKY